MNVKERATEMFKKFDVDNSGGICADELSEILKSLEVAATTEEINALFSYLDVNGDGSISLKELHHLDGFPATDGSNDELKTQRKKDVVDVLKELP
eukprot:CAMPEP_0198148302 /NCGR_PEP_ID=MMETSP1443-20131203/40866_1 /TAXON_ID=186043 /ORGANISM="Entomoneis sp., Strain CCMP2396" /LENGTH=95 /DNA_ID=CAMNT_0043812957 /DNA_START=448 /DNA_END=736 /DNA_ORIENTATION=-